MIERALAATLFTLYQVAIAMSIALLPVALLTNRFGVTLPVHQLVDATERAYEHTAP